MTGQRTPEERIAWWLEEEADGRLPDHVLDATFARTRAIRRRPGLSTWRPSPMSRPYATLLAVGAAAIILVLGFNALRPPSTPAIVGSTPSPSIIATPSPTSVAPSQFAPLGYPGSGTIAFSRHAAAGGDDVWLVDPDGTDETVLATGGCCALWAPDGHQLAIGLPGARPDGETTAPGVQLFDFPSLDRGKTVPSICGACDYHRAPYLPDAWSPDGRFVAVDFEGGAPDQQGLAIAARGSTDWIWGRAYLTGQHPDYPLTFSPDSSRLLFLREERTEGSVSVGTLQLFTFGSDPSSSTTATRPVLPAGFELRTNGLIGSPASWTADGRSVVFAGTDTRSGSNRTSIFEVDLDASSSVRTVVEDATGATSARLSPDGRWIVFDRDMPGGLHDLVVVHPDGSAETSLTSSFGPGVCCGQWSPDGSAILAVATETDDEHEDLVIVPLDGGPIHQVTQRPNGYTAFLWGPVAR